MVNLNLEQITNADYAIQLLCANNKEALKGLHTTPDEVRTLVAYGRAYWYQQNAELKEGR